MHMAIGYRWFATAAGCHLDRALRALGHTVDYTASFRRAVGHGQSCRLRQAAAPDVRRPLDLPTLYHVGFVGGIARAHLTSARCLASLLSFSQSTHDRKI
jgi:hypothetical protein